MIYKRGGKSYHYSFRFTLRRTDGTKAHFRIRQCARTANKQDALGVEAAHLNALTRGEIHPNDPWPKPKTTAPAPVFRAFSKRFLRFAQVHTKKGTHRFYSGCIERLLAFAPIADATLDAITTETAGEYADYRLDICENEIPSVNGDLRTLRRTLRVAVEWGQLKHAPAIHELPGSEGRDRILDWSEEARYLAAASPNLRDAAIILVDGGFRPNSELYPLCWPNVDLTQRPETPHGVIHVRAGKSDAAKRSVPLTPRVAEVLRRRKMENDARPETERSPYVFPGDGDSGHLVSLQQVHAEAVEKAKLDWFVIYSLRHTFGTRAAQSGMDKYSLARLMGHSSPTITARYYIHVTEPHVTQGFGKFAEYQAKGVAEGIAAAFPDASKSVQ